MNKSPFRKIKKGLLPLNFPIQKETKEIGQLHVSFIVEKRKNGDLIVPIPKEVVMAYKIEVGDAAVFEITDEGILIHFVQKSRWGVTEKYDEKKNDSVSDVEKRRKVL